MLVKDSSEQVQRQVAAAFADAQRSQAAHPRARRALLAACKRDSAAFLDAFLHALNRALIVFSREPAVERVVTFVANFVASLAVDSDTIVTSQQHVQNFTSLVLYYLLEHASASSKAVRFRSCQILASALKALPEEAALDDILWENMQTTLLLRSMDKVPRVRAAAATALCRLQTSGNPVDDAVAAALASLVQADSSSAVRKAALASIAVCEETIPVILRRTRDVKEDVRRAAYATLASKLHPNDLSVEVRIEILRAGLEDRSSCVRKVCAEELLVSGWLEGACESNVLALIELLGGSSYEKEILVALRIIFAMRKCATLSSAVVVDVNNLTPEDVLILRAMSDVKSCARRLEDIIPSVLIYSEILKYYCLDEYASRNLLPLSRRMDMSDEAGRKALELTLRTCFLTNSGVTESIIADAVSAMRIAMLTEESASRVLVEIILQDLIPLATAVKHNCENHTKCVESSGQGSCDRWALLRALSISKSLLRGATSGKSITSSSNTMYLSLMQQVVIPRLSTANGEQRRDALECLALFCLLGTNGDEGRLHLPLFMQACRNDNQSIRILALQSVTDLFMMFDFAEEEVIDPPCISQTEDARDDKENSKTPTCQKQSCRHASTIIAESHVEKPLLSNSRTRFSDTGSEDIVVTDIDEDDDEFFSANGSPSGNFLVTSKESRLKAGKSTTAHVYEEVIALVTDNITCSDGTLRTTAVECLARLLFSRRIRPDPKLLSRLLLAYFNPVNEDDDCLRQCLSVFFPAFAFSSPYHRVVLESAFCPTLRVLLDAPRNSPLSSIPKLDVALYMLHLTNPASVSKNQSRDSKSSLRHAPDPADTAGTTHERIAESLLGQLLDVDVESELEMCKLYTRILGSIRLIASEENAMAIQRIGKLTHSVSASLSDKRCSMHLQRFQKHISGLM